VRVVSPDVIYRYLKFRSRRGYVRGSTVCRHLRLPFQLLRGFDDLLGLGSIGPAGDKFPKARHRWLRYARRNFYMADFRYFFKWNGRIYCYSQRTLRKGKFTPRKKGLHHD
jgi:hypothetical protein